MRAIVAAVMLGLLLIATVSAVPVTGALAKDIGSNNATLYMTGAATTCWFQYGMQTGENMTWKSPNQTPSGGLCNYTIYGSPITPVTIFYFRACDTTGCGASSSFTTSAVTVIPTSTYGSIFDNLTESNFDITRIGMSTIQPLYWVVPSMPSLIWALLFMGLFIGMWLRGRDLGYVALIGIIVSVAFMGTTSSYGLGIVVDPVFSDMGQGIVYATVAGIILAIIKK